MPAVIVMKTKPYLPIIAAALLLAGTTLFTQCKSKTNNTNDGIVKFLALFNLQVKSAQTDSLVNHFDMPKRKQEVIRFINLLCGKTGSDKNKKPNFKLELNDADYKITTVSTDVSTATISVSLHRDSLEGRSSTISLRIKKTANDYKIINIETKKFLDDYTDYENYVFNKTLTDKDIYSPQTLAAFATADSLKARYDTIPWFQHLNGKTYFFVVNGDKNFIETFYRDTVIDYKMGLVGPNRKEVVPAAYDLVHNIGATYPTLIEVEKDHKRGFYNLDGQIILPVEYDQIFPLNDAANLAVLRKGDDYYWWKNDYTVSDKDAGIQIADLLPRIKNISQNLTLKTNSFSSVTECNSRDQHNSIFIPPSYLVDLGLMAVTQEFINPLRRNVDEEGSKRFEIKSADKNSNDSWLASVFYSIRNYFVGGRSDFYDSQKVIVASKKNNRLYGADVTTDFSEMGEGAVANKCNLNYVRQLNDSLYEVRTSGELNVWLYNDKYVDEGPGYHYLMLKNNKLKELPNNRRFGFTKYVRMTDSYLNTCYTWMEDSSRFNKATVDMLRYMKNEIYADYQYNFKDTTWRKIFESNMGNYYREKGNYHDNVEDSLTAIDKFNIAFINNKLKVQQPLPRKTLAAAR